VQHNPSAQLEKSCNYHPHNRLIGRNNELLSDFAVQHAASLGILTLLRDKEWSRVAYHPEYGHFTAEAWVGHWVEHDLTHIQQIEHIIAAYPSNQ
jgi:hypothetical protein